MPLCKLELLSANAPQYGTSRVLFVRVATSRYAYNAQPAFRRLVESIPGRLITEYKIMPTLSQNNTVFVTKFYTNELKYVGLPPLSVRYGRRKGTEKTAFDDYRIVQVYRFVIAVTAASYTRSAVLLRTERVLRQLRREIGLLRAYALGADDTQLYKALT